jgi:hypothetical protein
MGSPGRTWCSDADGSIPPTATIVMAGEGPPFTAVPPARGKVVDADRSLPPGA